MVDSPTDQATVEAVAQGFTEQVLLEAHQEVDSEAVAAMTQCITCGEWATSLLTSCNQCNILASRIPSFWVLVLWSVIFANRRGSMKGQPWMRFGSILGHL